MYALAGVPSNACCLHLLAISDALGDDLGYPDLAALPVLAFAIVPAYHIPELLGLVLLTQLYRDRVMSLLNDHVRPLRSCSICKLSRTSISVG